MKDHQKGVLIVLVGVLCISPDAVLVRFLSDEGRTDPWIIAFWKLVFSLPITATYALYENGGSLAAMGNHVVEGPWYYLCSVPVQVGVNYCFTLAFAYTSAAQALLLVNLNPLWCAVIGRWLLGDHLPMRTILALGGSLICMLIIFVPEIVGHGNEDDGEDSASVGGNLIALLAGVLLAANISIMRKASQVDINLIGSTPMAGILGSLIALVIQAGDVMPDPVQWPEPWQFWAAVMADGLAVGIVYASLTVAPRLVTGAEVALVVLLEVILGPLWVFVAYGDVPTLWTLIGGSILLAVLAVHESIPLFQKAQLGLKRMSSTMMLSNHQTEEGEPIDELCSPVERCGGGIKSDEENK